MKEIRDYLVEVELKIDFLCENFMAQTVLNTRKLLFLSNHEIIWNIIRRRYKVTYYTGLLGSGPKVKSSAPLGSGPKVKSQATVLWRQTQGAAL